MSGRGTKELELPGPTHQAINEYIDHMANIEDKQLYSIGLVPISLLLPTFKGLWSELFFYGNSDGKETLYAAFLFGV